MPTYEVLHTPGYPYWVIERRHDGENYASTGTPIRCVAGPYLDYRGAHERLELLETIAATVGVA